MAEGRSLATNYPWRWRVVVLLAWMAGMAAWPGGGVAGTRELCAQWRQATGTTKAALANELGAAHHLTKNKRLDEAEPGARRSLYRHNDLQRLCRTS